MTPAVLTAVLVVLIGARVRPTSPIRLPTAAPPPAASQGRSVPSRATRTRRLAQRFHPDRNTADPATIAAWCDRLARAVRSGSTLSTAICETEPPPGCADDIDRVVLALGRGASLTAALAPDPAHPHLGLALTVIRTCGEQGGPAAEPLDRVAATLRTRAADLAERRTFSAQARMSAIVMTLLPLAMLAVLMVASRSTRTSIATPVGLAVLAVGLSLNLLGWRWMRRLIDGGTP